ncbi:MAG: class I SAM-dependent methyltransferase [Hydrogenibacillus schlegelii]|nr:class I SAM-dependent methyltransferase [Hydrogenibacillus schlegelii]
MRRRAERRLRERDLAGALIAAFAEALPFADGRLDAVVSTLVLCSVRDPRKAMAEIRRVLKPGGRFLALEHVRIDVLRWAGWALDRLTPAWSRLADGLPSQPADGPVDRRALCDRRKADVGPGRPRLDRGPKRRAERIGRRSPGGGGRIRRRAF